MRNAATWKAQMGGQAVSSGLIATEEADLAANPPDLSAEFGRGVWGGPPDHPAPSAQAHQLRREAQGMEQL